LHTPYAGNVTIREVLLTQNITSLAWADPENATLRTRARKKVETTFILFIHLIYSILNSYAILILEGQRIEQLTF
jgi:hypothetical protein